MSDIPQFLSRTDVPKYYPICQRVVDEWIANGVMPIIRVKSKPILRSGDINDYLNSLVAVKPKSRRGRPSKAEQIAKRKTAEIISINYVGRGCGFNNA